MDESQIVLACAITALTLLIVTGCSTVWSAYHTRTQQYPYVWIVSSCLLISAIAVFLSAIAFFVPALVLHGKWPNRLATCALLWSISHDVSNPTQGQRVVLMR